MSEEGFALINLVVAVFLNLGKVEVEVLDEIVANGFDVVGFGLINLVAVVVPVLLDLGNVELVEEVIVIGFDVVAMVLIEDVYAFEMLPEVVEVVVEDGW